MRQNITVKTILQELNINKDVLYKMTRGGAPSYITIARICDYLNMSIDALLDRAAPATPAPPNLSPLRSTPRGSSGSSGSSGSAL